MNCCLPVAELLAGGGTDLISSLLIVGAHAAPNAVISHAEFTVRQVRQHHTQISGNFCGYEEEMKGQLDKTANRQ